MTPSTSESMQQARWSFVWLGLAAVMTLLSAGRWVVPIAAWLAGLWMLRFVRTQPMLRGYLLGVVGGLIPTAWAMYGMFPQPLGAFLATLGIGSAIGFLPYLLDRWVAVKRKDFAATLVFPSALVVGEYLNALTSPFGTWASLLYTQTEFLSFLQISAVTGPWGVIFVMGWLASVVNWAWERDFAWPEVRRGIFVCLAVLGVIGLGGGMRLAFAPWPEKTVRVAGILSPEHRKVWSIIKPVFRGQRLDAQGWEAFYREAKRVNDDLFKRSEQAALAGAKILVWGEAIGAVRKREEAALIDRGKSLARTHKIYLGMSLWSLLHEDLGTLPQKKMVENKLILISPLGEVAWSYLKAIPVPGMEAAMTVAGSGAIPSVQTPYGRLGGAICFDMDFPDLLRQAGRQKIDLMLVPAGDWPQITPHHTLMASLRAIENGFSLLRVVNQGYSAAFDPLGRLQAGMNYFTTAQYTLYADLPTQGTRTLYPLLGDWLAWASILLLLAALFQGFFQKAQDAPSPSAGG